MFVSSVATCPYNYHWTCGTPWCSMWYGVTVNDGTKLANYRGKHFKYGWPMCIHWFHAAMHAKKTDTLLKAHNDWQERTLAFAMGMHHRLGQDSRIRGLDPEIIKTCGFSCWSAVWGVYSPVPCHIACQNQPH